MDTALNIARAIRDGETTAEQVVRDCLDRIDARDADVKAWAYLDPDRTLAEAKARDTQGPDPARPLHGVPVGVKDIIDTHDMPTGMGSPIYDGHRPPADAGCVALVRAAGGIILGKTVTAEFAGLTPNETTNPYDAARTPGGSSSGSAAAVADGMVPLAFGTQTGGSVLRPSSYCGIFGYKPTFGTFNLAGVFPAAQSLDTLGLHANALEDLALFSDALLNRPPAPIVALGRAPRVGLCRTSMWAAAQPETQAAIDDATARLSDVGAKIVDVELPGPFEDASDARPAINDWERSRVLGDAWGRHREKLSPGLQDTVERGLALGHAEYVNALRLAEDCRALLPRLFGGIDVLLTPTVDGEAPVGIDDTGSPRFQSLWTMLHVPTMTLPTHKGPNDLPVGIQLVAPYRADDHLFSCADWVWSVLGRG